MRYQDLAATGLPRLLRRDDLVIIDMRDAVAQARGRLTGAQPASEPLVHGLARRRREAPPIRVYRDHGHSSRDLCTLLAAGASLCIRTHDGHDALDSASTPPVLRHLKPPLRRAG